MEPTWIGQVLVAEQTCGPDRWCRYFRIVDELADSVGLIELPRTVVAGDDSRGTEVPLVAQADAVAEGAASGPVLRASKTRDHRGGVVFLCEDRGLVLFGGSRSWNEAGEVQRENCLLRPWDGRPAPFEYH